MAIHSEEIFVLLAQAALRGPPDVAFAMRSLLLLLPSFNLSLFGLGGFACATQGGVAMCSWPLLLPLLSLSLSRPTSGKLPCVLLSKLFLELFISKIIGTY